MSKAFPRGRTLLAEIEDDVDAAPRLWWLGHSGFAVKYLQAVIYIDPYLSAALGPRLVEPPLDASDVGNAGLVLCTHAHPDHLDASSAAGILTASRRAKLVVPKAAGEHAHSLGIPYDRMVTTNADLRVEFLDDRIYAVPSAHDALDWTPIGGFPYLGYLVRFGRTTIYHAGDCVPYQGLAARLRPYNVTVALLPISGHPRPGRPGNFEPQEAAQLAEEIGASWVVPMHYGVITDNTADVNRFIEHMLGHRPSQRFKVFDIGEGWTVPAE